MTHCFLSPLCHVWATQGKKILLFTEHSLISDASAVVSVKFINREEGFVKLFKDLMFISGSENGWMDG